MIGPQERNMAALSQALGQSYLPSSHCLIPLWFPTKDEQPTFLAGHFYPISSFLSAQDGISELPNFFFLNEEATSYSDKFLGPQ